MLTRIVTFLLFFPYLLFAYVSPGQPSGFVNDFTGVLSGEDRVVLESKIAQFKKDSGNEISVAVIKSLGDEPIENYAVRLFEEWGVGGKSKDNGILLVIALDDRRMRIEVGYGLEGALTDIQSHSIINNVLKPAFQRGDYYGGIDKAIDDISLATKGEYKTINQSKFDGLDIDWVNIAGLIFIVVVSVLARSKSWWAGGVAGAIFGALVSFIYGLFYIGITSLILFIPLGLFIDFISSKAYQHGAKTGRYPWWMGGGPHGGSGFGGGFGGFGGGRSGGGGSSGDW